MPQTEQELITTTANRAMGIHRVNKVVIPLAIHKAVSEQNNLTVDQQNDLKKKVHKELVRRSGTVKRMGNKYHNGVGSSLHRSRKKIGL